MSKKTETVEGIETIMRVPAVVRATGLSRSTILDRVKQGRFPPPMRLDPGGPGRAVGWFASAIAQHQRILSGK